MSSTDIIVVVSGALAMGAGVFALGRWLRPRGSRGDAAHEAATERLRAEGAATARASGSSFY